MGGDTNLNGSGPLVHHLVNADLENLTVAQWPVAQDHAVVEIIRGTAKGERIRAELLLRGQE